MAAGKRRRQCRDAGRAGGGGAGGRCSACRRHKDKVHRSRKTGKLVCATCADRARMRLGACADCGQRKLLQARGRCYACYKRQWRSPRRTRAGAARTPGARLGPRALTGHRQRQSRTSDPALPTRPPAPAQERAAGRRRQRRRPATRPARSRRRRDPSRRRTANRPACRRRRCDVEPPAASQRPPGARRDRSATRAAGASGGAGPRPCARRRPRRCRPSRRPPPGSRPATSARSRPRVARSLQRGDARRQRRVRPEPRRLALVARCARSRGDGRVVPAIVLGVEVPDRHPAAPIAGDDARARRAPSPPRGSSDARSNQRATTCQAFGPGWICQIRMVRSRLAPASQRGRARTRATRSSRRCSPSCSSAPSAARNWPGLHFVLPRAPRVPHLDGVVAAAVGEQRSVVGMLDPCLRHRPEPVAREALHELPVATSAIARVVAQPRRLLAEVAADRDARPVGRPREAQTTARQRDHAGRREMDVRRRRRRRGRLGLFRVLAMGDTLGRTPSGTRGAWRTAEHHAISARTAEARAPVRVGRSRAPWLDSAERARHSTRARDEPSDERASA